MTEIKEIQDDFEDFKNRFFKRLKYTTVKPLCLYFYGGNRCEAGGWLGFMLTIHLPFLCTYE